MSQPYDQQDRGAEEDYAAYFAGMDRSMQQKIALTTAHFPPTGTVADMGCGSGQGTADLASLATGLTVVGVDIDPKTVALAARAHARERVRFVEGDISREVFAPGALDAVLDSSVLHHVTSFNGFSLAALERALDHQVAALREGGVLVVRDFVIPRGPLSVLLELPADDGDDDGPVPSLSTAALFERFLATFRGSLGRPTATARPASRPGARRYEVTHRLAAEFVLRKDYRDHWEAELREEYTYYSQADFERAFASRGLRVVTSVELHNPWIVEHRFEGRFTLHDLEGARLPWPPTNFLIVGEKVPASAGVRLEEASRERLAAPRFLSLSRYRDQRDGEVFELASRPGRTVDVLPYFVEGDRAFVLCKRGFPRPIVNAASDAPDLCGQTGAGWITEPISLIAGDDEPPRDAALRALELRAGGARVVEVSEPWRYYTSPGGVDERVEAFLVEVEPWRAERAITNYTPFSGAGHVTVLDAAQLLRACHVGGMFDARLELNVSRLCHARGLSRGPWIGAEPSFVEHATAPDPRPLPPARACFVRLPEDGAEPSFLEVIRGTFVERAADGRALAEAEFEYVRPRALSHNTLTMLPVIRAAGRVWVGLEPRELPAVQQREGASALLTLPALRLPRSITTLDAARAHGLARLEAEHHLRARRAYGLGGRYHPSAGVTPEIVYPLVVDVAELGRGCELCFRPLDEALALPLVDAHLLTSLYRLAHALA
ncbi:MAG: class I SAM-dependent methyltransferase [Polyangiaceae bacterium]|nr:class I SAM-dependent methyltransferase [Polyangiaceae bacterium]